jgi:WD40 repeat protein
VQLTGHALAAVAAAVSPDGKRLATGDQDNAVRLWDLTNPAKESELLVGHSDSVRSLAFSPAEPILASASLDFTIRLWHLDEPGIPSTELSVEELWQVQQVAFSADGRYLVAADNVKQVFIWDLTNLAAGPRFLIDADE